MLEQPARFQAAEIGAQWEPGGVAKTVLSARCRKTRDLLRYPRVLPDNRVRNRNAGLPFPDDRGFALVGNSHGGQLLRRDSRALDGFFGDLQRASYDFGRVVLHPAGLGVNLLVLFLSDTDHASIGIKNHETRAGRALVDRADVLFQVLSPLTIPMPVKIR